MRPEGCIYGKDNCIVEGGNCDKIGVVYRITCKGEKDYEIVLYRSPSHRKTR